ncbi:MAG: VOC family protein [Streptosporangiales bacterium]|nr:VOC family protein [Streptosporangiales bacterium]MBO0890658.1 VOC family protein [Acidothermales bacterium]
MTTTLTPRLIVSGAAKAIEFYRAALGAEEVSRYADATGAVVHTELSVDGAVFTLKDESPTSDPGVGDQAPTSYGGTPVFLSLTVPDARGVGARMEAAGATVVFPIDDHPYGTMGRLADPFGHVWMIHQDG